MHNIQEHDQIIALESTWHGLEQRVDAIDFANSGLDWEVSKRDLFFEVDPIVSGDDFTKVAERVGVIRTDKKLCLGVVSPQYHVVSNRDLFESALRALDNVDHKVVVTGSLDNCRKVFISIELAEHSKYKIGDDEFKSHFTLYNSHDGSESLRAYDTATRVVCENTLNFSMNGAKTFDWKGYHSRDIASQLNGMENLLQSLLVNREQQFERLSNLTDRTMTRGELEALICGTMMTSLNGTDRVDLKKFLVNEGNFELSAVRKNRIADISSRFSERQIDKSRRGISRVGLGNHGRSRYDALNAFTEYHTHGAVDTKRDLGQIVGQSEFGRAAASKALFFNLLVSETEETARQFDDALVVGEKVLSANV